jgi:poly(3-hydroxybutyrate) depolymerase
MRPRSSIRWFAASILLAAIFSPALVKARPADGTTLEDIEPSGNNYDKAAFKLWLPDNTPAIRAVLVLMPGSNGDARPQVDDDFWRKFATDHNLALLGCEITDKPHDQKFVEQYANVSLGSGQTLLDALALFAKQSKHSELVGAPLLLWGMSAGGEFNYEFAAWKPEQVAAFVVNKGGIYFTALAPQSSRNVPGMLFIGGKDLESRIDIITGLFALNRRGGALWALAEEPSAAHVVGRSRDLAAMFFEDVLPLRVSDPGIGAPRLKPIPDGTGFVGDLKGKTFQPVASAGTQTESTVWLPSMRVARAWQDLITEKPFDSQ